MIIILALMTAAACTWAAAITDRLSTTRARHARYVSRPRLRSHGKRRLGHVIQERVTAADWPPAPAAVVHG